MSEALSKRPGPQPVEERSVDELHLLRMQVTIERIARIEAELRAAKLDRTLVELQITAAVCKDGESIVKIDFEKKVVCVVPAPATTPE